MMESKFLDDKLHYMGHNDHVVQQVYDNDVLDFFPRKF